MSKPDKPIEAQGLGCGLILSVVCITAFLSWLGLPPAVSIWIAVAVACVSLIGYAVNQFKSQRVLDDTYKTAATRKTNAPASAMAKDDCGKYRVVGVDRESGMDTTWYTDAASAANAKIKGELQGIIVTEVTRS